MKKFEKIILKPDSKRDKLGRINTRIRKGEKKPNILQIEDLDLNTSTKSIISRILPQIERVSSTSFPKPIKSALIADILGRVSNDIIPSSSEYQLPSSPKQIKKSSPPKWSTPLPDLRAPKNNILSDISQIYDSRGIIWGADGSPIPEKHIDEAVSWIEKKVPAKKRAPLQVKTIAHKIASKKDRGKKALEYISNPEFHKLVDYARKRIDERVRAELKKQKREQRKEEKKRARERGKEDTRRCW